MSSVLSPRRSQSFCFARILSAFAALVFIGETHLLSEALEQLLLELFIERIRLVIQLY
jgi:hypothetical protein